MAGLGFGRGGGGRGGGRGGCARPSENRGMGIQFVKSSETFHAEAGTGITSPSDSSPRQPGPRAGHWGAPARDLGSAPVSGGPVPLLQIKSEVTDNNGPQASQNSVTQGSLFRFGGPAKTESSCGDKMSFNYSGGSRFGQAFVKSGDAFSSTHIHSRGPGHGGDYRMPGSVSLNKGAPKSIPTFNSIPRTPEAKPVLSKEEYLTAWRKEKDPMLEKFRKLAYEVVNLKSDRPNAKDKLHSAANRVPIRIEFNTEPVLGAKNNNSFLCYVFVEGVTVASGNGVKMKDSKTNAYEAALQKILMPHLRIVQLDPDSSELHASKEPFSSPPPEPSKVPLAKSAAKIPPSAPGAAQKSRNSKEVASQHKESNLEAACLKRRFNEFKPLEEFVIVEPLVPIPDCTPAHTLRRSADFNHMLLEYEYFFRGEAARCVAKIENQVLADVNGVSKVAAKNTAASQALRELKKICWVIKTKKAVDSDTKISKDEMLNELNDQSDVISRDNIGNKLLRKMGWSGGGVGKDGSGIAEPVVLKSVLNREGLGLSAAKGITDEFRKRVREVIESYASSENQEDLVFACDFRLDERQIIHDECRRLNLRSKVRGKGQQRYLCVRRKRSANQLFDHIMSCGGETARYVLMPPGSDVNSPQLPPPKADGTSGAGKKGGAAAKDQNKNGKEKTNGPKPLMNLPTGQGKGSQGGLIGNGLEPQGTGKMPRNGPVLQGMHNMKRDGFGQGFGGMGSDKDRMNGPTNMSGGGGMQNPGMGNNFGQNPGVGNNMQGMGGQWGIPQQKMGNMQGMGSQLSQYRNGQGMGMQNMGNNPMGMSNEQGTRMPNFGMSNGQGMGMQNMGNNTTMGMANGQGMGMQGMGNNTMGISNIRNNNMGMPNGQGMGTQNMGNQINNYTQGQWGDMYNQWGSHSDMDGSWDNQSNMENQWGMQQNMGNFQGMGMQGGRGNAAMSGMGNFQSVGMQQGSGNSSMMGNCR